MELAEARTAREPPRERMLACPRPDEQHVHQPILLGRCLLFLCPTTCCVLQPPELLVRVVALAAEHVPRQCDGDDDRNEDRQGDHDLERRRASGCDHRPQASTRSRAAPTPTSSTGMPRSAATNSTYLQAAAGSSRTVVASSSGSRQPGEHLPHGLGVVEVGLVRREVAGLAAVGKRVRDADRKLVEVGEHVELGEGEGGHAVDAHGVAERDQVEPAAAPLAPGDGAVLAAEPGGAAPGRDRRSPTGMAPPRRASRMPWTRPAPGRSESARSRSRSVRRRRSGSTR